MGELMEGSGKKVLLITALAAAFIGATLVAQDASNVKGNRKADVQDVLLNDFETSEDWRAFSTTPLGITKVRKTTTVTTGRYHHPSVRSVAPKPATCPPIVGEWVAMGGGL